MIWRGEWLLGKRRPWALVCLRCGFRPERWTARESAERGAMWHKERHGQDHWLDLRQVAA